MKTWMLICMLSGAVLLTACGTSSPETTEPTEAVTFPVETTTEPIETAAPEPLPEPPAPPQVLYQGHGSLRIVTAEEKVIYIDPYAGEGYDLPADLILITHGHGDHNGLGLIQNRTPDCRVITQQEALTDGQHQVFDLDYVHIRAVEAGNNANHSTANCVGYLLTFRNGRTLYVSGDTSQTQEMAALGEVDYAFFCCDGVYNMGPKEAAACAQIVGAKHNIPYHTAPATGGNPYSEENANAFTAPNPLILHPGESFQME